MALPLLEDGRNSPLFPTKKLSNRVTDNFNNNKGLTNLEVINVSGYLCDRLQAIGSTISIPHKLLDKTWLCRSKVEILVINDLLIELKSYLTDKNKKQFRSSAYKQGLSCLLANLRYCSEGHKQLALIYKRDTSETTSMFYNPLKISAKVLNDCVDFMHYAGYVTAQIGTRNEYDGIASSMIVSDQLRYRLEAEKIEIALCKGAPMIKLNGFKNIKGIAKVIPLPRTVRGMREAKGLSLSVEAYNSCWLEHTAYLGSDRLIPFCYRVFNNESLELGGRFYGAEHQGISKKGRASILIDGYGTVEPDFKALHYCLLYAFEGLHLDPLIDDPYTINGYHRDTIKLASLMLLNINSASSFKANVTRSGNPETKAKYLEYKQNTNPNKRKPEYLKGFIEGMPDHINGTELHNAICKKHKAIKHLFHSADIGLKLQYADSKIMARIIQLLAAQNIPLLPVHDSIIVREHDILPAELAMMTAYKTETGFTPCIDY